jgi:hypothetical protein
MQPKGQRIPEDDAPRSKVVDPAHSSERAPNDMLPPSAAAPQAPGTPGLAGELPSEPITHRRKPEEQNPVPSEHWFPPVSD